jgi:hypothetical protein
VTVSVDVEPCETETDHVRAVVSDGVSVKLRTVFVCCAEGERDMLTLLALSVFTAEKVDDLEVLELKEGLSVADDDEVHVTEGVIEFDGDREALFDFAELCDGVRGRVSEEVSCEETVGVLLAVSVFFRVAVSEDVRKLVSEREITCETVTEKVLDKVLDEVTEAVR